MIGSGSALANFQAKLGLDSTDYAKGMINAESVSRIFGDTFSTFVSNPLLGSIAIIKNVSKALISGSIDMLAYSEEVERMAQITGASEPLLIGLTKQLELAGFSSERARQGFIGFNKFLADYNNQGPLSNEILRQMGVNIDNMDGVDSIFKVIIEGLNNIENPATKAGIAAKLFGEEAGPELINAIGGGADALDDMIDRYTRLGFIVEHEANSSMAGLNTTLGVFQQAVDGVQNNFLVEFLLGISGSADLTNESIIDLADTLNNELSPIAHELGELVTTLLPVMTQLLEIHNGLMRSGRDFLTSSLVGSVEDLAPLVYTESAKEKSTRLRFEKSQQLVIQEFGV